MHVSLPDGSKLELPAGATGLDAAAAIGPRLASATAAVKVNGELRDFRLPLADGDAIEIVRVGDDEALPVLRHSTAHVLAEAARHVFPGVRIAFGPAIENGFYYDFEFPRAVSDADLELLEAEMRRILGTEHRFERSEVAREEARQHFSDAGEAFKVEAVDRLPEDAPITFYEQDDFVDLCRGPHLQTTKPIKAFKLLSVAGAYWLGDSDRPQLTRVYGTAFFDQKALDAHLHRIEEARRRDHRRLGPQLGLFSFHDESPAAPFWHPNGFVLLNQLIDMWREENRRRGYHEVKTPILFSVDMWKTSGHWDKYRDHMYLTDIDGRPFGLKPMNCPGHILIYESERKSYRDLPLRMNEIGLVHRHEPSGTLHGLLRVRHISQDDAHIFCTEDQMVDEIVAAVDFSLDLYTLFGMEYRLELSTRPENRVGSDEFWDRAEAALAQALDRRGLEYQVNEGDGAFYGPKIDMHLTDSLGRSWQCGTVQLDFNFPERFDLTYTGADDEEHRPVMIHRAMLGSLERFVGILIEHYAGAFPLWLAPWQAVVLPIADRHAPYAESVVDRLRAAGLRARADLRGESVGKKIAEAEAGRIPVMLVVGDREQEAGRVSVRRLGRRDLGARDVDAVLADLAAEAAERRAELDGA
jgi:threonyl-tRNA synthetase